MPFLLTGIGLILIVTGIRDTYAQLGAQLKNDFTGQQNFTVWILAIGSVGALGYINELQTFSRYFLALIIISLILSNQGFFQKFSAQWSAGPQAIPGSGIPGAGTTSSASTPFGVFPADPNNTLAKQQSGLFGQAPASEGNAWANGWFNFLSSPSQWGRTSP